MAEKKRFPRYGEMWQKWDNFAALDASQGPALKNSSRDCTKQKWNNGRFSKSLIARETSVARRG